MMGDPARPKDREVLLPKFRGLAPIVLQENMVPKCQAMVLEPEALVDVSELVQ